MPDLATDSPARNRNKGTGAEGAGMEQNDMNDHAGGSEKPEEKEETQNKEKRPSVLGRVWKKLDLDVPTTLMMIK
jgi:hypothetical protein